MPITSTPGANACAPIISTIQSQVANKQSNTITKKAPQYLGPTSPISPATIPPSTPSQEIKAAFLAFKYFVGGVAENIVRVPLSNIGGTMQNAATDILNATENSSGSKLSAIARSPIVAAQDMIKTKGRCSLYFTFGVSNAIRPFQRFGAFSATDYLSTAHYSTPAQAIAVAAFETIVLTPIEATIKDMTGATTNNIPLSKRTAAAFTPSLLRNFTFLLPYLYGKEALKEDMKKHPVAAVAYPFILGQACVGVSHIFELWQTKAINFLKADLAKSSEPGFKPKGYLKIAFESGKDTILKDLSKEGIVMSTRSLAVRGGSVGIGFTIALMCNNFFNGIAETRNLN